MTDRPRTFSEIIADCMRMPDERWAEYLFSLSEEEQLIFISGWDSMRDELRHTAQNDPKLERFLLWRLLEKGR